jgi:uncharacterized membrane protein
MIDEIIQSSSSEYLIVFILAALPLAELRGSLPVGIEVLGIPWYCAFLLSVLGNILPVPFLLLFFDALSKLAYRTKRGRQFTEWLYRRTRRQSGVIEKYGHLGLIFFVAIPLPGTGAWTASLAAHLLGMKFWPTLISIILGVIGAGIIVTGLILLGWIGAGIAILAVLCLACFSIWKRAKRKDLSTEQY